MKLFRLPWLLILGAVGVALYFKEPLFNFFRSNGMGKVADVLTPKNNVTNEQ